MLRSVGLGLGRAAGPSPATCMRAGARYWIASSGPLGAPGAATPASAAQRRLLFSRAAKAVAKNDAAGTKAAGRFPKFMAKYAASVAGAPVSHITGFILMHELTAIVPLFGIWGLLYYFDVGAGLPFVPEWVMDQGTEFIRKLAERNGWTYVAHAEKGAHVLLQGASAYAIVKALLPIRLVFSVWTMPWAAKHIVIPTTSVFKRVWNAVLRRKPADAGKNAVAQGALPKTLQKKELPPDPRRPPGPN